MSEQVIAGLAGLGGLGLMKKAYSDLGGVGEDALEYLTGGVDLGEGGLAGYIEEQQRFVPYGVTTATGSSFGMATDPVTGETTYSMDLSEDERARQQRLFALSDEILGQVGGSSVEEREQAVFDRMLAGMSPEMERQRLALEQRLQAQGRGGVTTSMFGGTPEQLAMAKGQQEALNNAFLNAMQFAGQEQTRLANLGTGIMNQGYVPQTMLLQGIAPGMTAAEQRRDQQNIQAGNFAETYLSGIEAQLAAEQARAGMLGGLGTAMVSGGLGIFDDED